MRWLVMGLLALCWTCEVWAGAWSQPRGGYYAKLSGIHYSTTEVFNDMGKRALMGMDDNKFRARQVLAYGEYGLLDRLTLTGQVGAGRLVSEDSFVERITWGLGDVHLGAKYQLTGGRLVLSPQSMSRFPAGTTESTTRLLGLVYSEQGRGSWRGCRSIRCRSTRVARWGTSSAVARFPIRCPILSSWGLRRVVAVCQGLCRQCVHARGGLGGGSGRSSTGFRGDFTEVGGNVAVQVAGPLWIDLLWKSVFKGENIGAGSSLA